ncbi:tripartite tricarboxylate transporter substrate binding protein [Bordetella petrii]|nr:tripartite tricarboxylate transporter substrate binding protein [Bordetella petrii]
MKPFPLLGKLAGACLAFALLAPGHAAPRLDDQPIQLVVGFSAGGPADTVARTLSQRLGAALGTSVVIVNRPGADGVIAASAVARAKPDGHTLLLAPSTLAINESLYKDLTYDTRGSFIPMTLIGESPNIIGVHPSLPVKTVPELVSYSRRPDVKLFFGSSSSVTLLATEMLKLETGAKMEKVPYKGAGQAIPALLSNEVQVMVSSVLTLLPQVQAGKVRALAVTSKSRLAIAPDIPSAAEQGLPDYSASTWYGLFAPAGTDESVVAAVTQAMQEVMSDPQVRAQFEKQGMVTDTGIDTPAKFAPYFQNEIQKWRKVVVDSGTPVN